MWHINFAFLTLRKYKMFKVEEQQYFSQNSSFGAQNRQVKGGAIKALTRELTTTCSAYKSSFNATFRRDKKE